MRKKTARRVQEDHEGEGEEEVGREEEEEGEGGEEGELAARRETACSRVEWVRDDDDG